MNSTLPINCPECGRKGSKVKIVTLESLLLPKYAANLTVDQYFFCTNHNCSIVYYSENDGNSFHKDQLRVRVGIKESTGARPVCYCFNINIETIEQEISSTGKSTASEEISKRLKHGCWCETRNPQGKCCVGTVRKIEKDSSGVNKARPSEETGTQSCSCC